MPWKERTALEERERFIAGVEAGQASMAELCREFGISRKTGYKWWTRWRQDGKPGLAGQSRRPQHSPGRTAADVEELVCDLRREHPAWGGRKLHHRLKHLGMANVPAPSTITGILARHDLLRADRPLRRDYQRFEWSAPNDLWQMDFMGDVATEAGRCYPLTVVDDHSRFNLCLAACTNQQALTVREQLSRVFAAQGLPQRLLMDNGAPWGSEAAHPHTRLTAWFMRLGITVLHGRPYHPQTQGKDERFHATLQREVLVPGVSWEHHDAVQGALDAWQPVYNYERPHEALDNAVPASRYEPSPRPFPATLPAVCYDRGEIVRKVQRKGRISFRNRNILVSRAFTGEYVALREVGDGRYDVYYCHQRVAVIDLSTISPGLEV